MEQTSCLLQPQCVFPSSSMNRDRASRPEHVLIAFACAVFVAACSEPYRSTVAQNPVPAVKAALVLSDSAPPIGGTLVVSVRAGAGEGTVGSYTAKISYDATARRCDG